MVSMKEPEFALRPGGWLATQIGEISVCVRSDADWVTREFTALYPGCRAEEAAAIAAIQMEVRTSGRSRIGWRLYRIFADGEELPGPRPRTEVFPFLEWGINLRVIARHSQYLQLHAASLACSGSGCLFAGGSGCGKSTLAAGLVARGWDYYCDEFALIEPAGLTLRSFPKALCIKAGSFSAVSALGLSFDRRKHYIKALKGRVGYVKPPAADARPAPIRYVVFPRYAANAEPKLTRITKGRAFLDLAGCVFNRSHFGEGGLPILAEVVRRCDCFVLETGDLAKTCSLLEAELGMIPTSATTRATLSEHSLGGAGERPPRRLLPSRREAIRIGARLAYVVPTVLSFSAQEAFAQASSLSGVCSTGVQTGGLCGTDLDCCSNQCSLGVCE